jgi:hypothetical protein
MQAVWQMASALSTAPVPQQQAWWTVTAVLSVSEACIDATLLLQQQQQQRQLPLLLQLRLDQPWLCSKLPLRATPLALTVYPEAHLLALATSRLSAPPRPYLPAEPGGDPVSAAAYATADAAAKAAGVEELNEVLLLAPPGFGLRMNTYVSVAGALAAAAAMAAAGSNATAAAAAAAAAEGGGGLLPVPSVGVGAAGSARSAAGSAARVAAAVAAAAGWAGLPLWRHSLLPGEDVMALK